MKEVFLIFIILCFIILCSLLLTSCARNQLVETNGTRVLPPPPPSPVRPAINRTANPAEVEPIVPETQITKYLNATIFTQEVPEGILVGDPEHPFHFGSKLGDALPILGRGSLSFLNAPMPFWHDQPLRAENYVRFDFEENTSGELRFTEDPTTKEPRPELFFAEGRPIFEYAYLLKDGAFPAMVGEDLVLFGHTYEIHDATNTSLELYGKDVEQYLLLENGSKLRVNKQLMADTSVSVDPWSAIITYYASDFDRDGIRLAPGETLREKLRQPEALLNEQFNIAFDGLEGNDDENLRFEAYDNRVELSFTDFLGEPLKIELANEQLEWGGKRLLHIDECKNRNDFCIAPKERFLLSSKEGATRVMEFRNVNDIGSVLTLRDVDSGEEHIVEIEDTGKNESGLKVMEGALRLYGTEFLIRVLHNETLGPGSRLAVDLDGNGRISGERMDLVLADGYTIEFPEEQPTGARTVELVVPELPKLDEERIEIRFKKGDEGMLVGTNATLFDMDENNDGATDWVGTSQRGAIITLHESDDGKFGDALGITYPRDYQAGIVRILG